MIVFDLQCGNAHVFEAWFGSSADFASQNRRKLISCPVCNDDRVKKAVMAPNVAAKGNQISSVAPKQDRQAVATIEPGSSAGQPTPAEMKRMMEIMSEFQAKVEATHENVGDRFAEESRKIHYGEMEHKLIYGEATLAEAAELHEEGIDILPLPFAKRKSKRLDA